MANKSKEARNDCKRVPSPRIISNIFANDNPAKAKNHLKREREKKKENSHGAISESHLFNSNFGQREIETFPNGMQSNASKTKRQHTTLSRHTH